MFIEPEHSLIDPPAPNHGVLSQNCGEHLLDRPAADPSALHQAGHHSHVLDYRRVVWPGAGSDGRGAGPVAGGLRGAVFAGPTLIEPALDVFTLGIAVIGRTALRRSPFAMGLPATKRATQIPAADVARMRQEENAAVPAPGPAGAQDRLGPQHGSQQPVILQNQGGYRALAIPVGLELKMFRDPNCKKPKLWLRMLT
jgi:hypothetical protein